MKGQDGKLQEEVYRAGTPDGRFPRALRRLPEAGQRGLANARAVAEPKQAQVIGDLIRFYQTGDFEDWLKFGEDWVQDNSTVDFANGFIEVYRDARRAKGSSQSFVTVTDKPLTATMEAWARTPQYFEQRAPWDENTRKAFSRRW